MNKEKGDLFSVLLLKATQGDEYAMNHIIEMYMPMIKNESIINGKVDDDLMQIIKNEIVLTIAQNKFENFL